MSRRRVPARVREIVDFAKKQGLDLSVTLEYVPPMDVPIQEWVDPEHVREMVEAIREADGWPADLPYPVVTNGATRELLDGSHRTAAALYEGMSVMPALAVDAEAFYAIQDEFDIPRFEYVHDILPHLDQRAAENAFLDKGADRDRSRSVSAYDIEPGSLGAAHIGRPGRMPPTLKAFGRQLRKFINRNDVITLLESGDWGQGGCWILAQALVEFLGPPAELVAVSERRQEDEILVPVSHVAVRYADVYIDYNGAQTEEEFLENLEAEGYEFPEIQEWSSDLAEIADQKGVPCDPRARKELLKLLTRRFGT